MDGLQNYEIRIWDADKRLLYVIPTVGMTELEADRKGAELLALHGGASYTLEPQVSGA